MIHTTYITYMSSEKEVTSGLLQLCVRFFVYSNSWNVNGIPQHSEEDNQEYWEGDSWLLTMFCHSLAYCFSWVIKNHIFYFQVSGNMVEVNIMHLQLQKFCRITFFRENLWISSKISFAHPSNCLLLQHLWGYTRAYARGLGLNTPSWAWYFTKTLLPLQRRL